MHEIRSVNPRRAAQLFAIVYGAMFGLLSLLMVPMFLIAPPPETPNGQPFKAFFLVMLILYPLVGAGMGWITGQVGSRLYNWASRKYGGLLVELAAVGDPVH